MYDLVALPITQVQGFACSPAGAAGAVAQQPSLRQAFNHIIRSEGIAALWKGNGATIMHRLPYSAINFWAYERLTEAWNATLPPRRGRSHTMDVARRLTAGGAAGMCACAVVSNRRFDPQRQMPSDIAVAALGNCTPLRIS